MKASPGRGSVLYTGRRFEEGAVEDFVSFCSGMIAEYMVKKERNIKKYQKLSLQMRDDMI